MSINKSYYVNAKHDLHKLRNINVNYQQQQVKVVGSMKDDYMKIIYDCYKDYKTSGSVKTIAKVHESIKNVNSYSTVYGELTYHGIELLGKMIERQKIKTFIDIGSGNGKIPIILAIEPSINQSFGVELVSERHENAMCVKNKLSEKPQFKDIIKKINIVNDDMFNIDYAKITNGTQTLVFISNLCFGEEITTQLFAKLAKELPIGSVVASSKIPGTIIDCFKPIDSNSTWNTPDLPISNGSTKMPMTWIDSSTVYFHQLVSRC